MFSAGFGNANDSALLAVPDDAPLANGNSTGDTTAPHTKGDLTSGDGEAGTKSSEREECLTGDQIKAT